VSSFIVGEVNRNLPSGKQAEIVGTLLSWGRVELLQVVHTSGLKVEGVKHVLREWVPIGRANVFMLARDPDRGFSTPRGVQDLFRPIRLPVR